jgi:hypothetical protein
MMSRTKSPWDIFWELNQTYSRESSRATMMSGGRTSLCVGACRAGACCAAAWGHRAAQCRSGIPPYPPRILPFLYLPSSVFNPNSPESADVTTVLSGRLMSGLPAHPEALIPSGSIPLHHRELGEKWGAGWPAGELRFIAG